MEELKKKRAVKKGKFTPKVKSLSEAISQRKSSEVLELLWKEVCGSFEEVQESNEQLQCIVNTEEESGECDEYISAVEKSKNELFELFLKKKNKHKQDIESLVKIKKRGPADIFRKCASLSHLEKIIREIC